MPTSLVYRSTLFYVGVMRLLYGVHYASRYRAIGAEVEPGSRVLELCCGPGLLYERVLRAKGVDYLGLDLNPDFVARVQRLGGRALVWDLNSGCDLPEADIVIMQASLYQFLPDPEPTLRRMRAAARWRVVIAEPIRNLATARVPVLSAYARRHTNAGQGARGARFDEAALDALFERLGLPVLAAHLIPGGREKVYVIDAVSANAPGGGPE